MGELLLVLAMVTVLMLVVAVFNQSDTPRFAATEKRTAADTLHEQTAVVAIDEKDSANDIRVAMNLPVQEQHSDTVKVPIRSTYSIDERIDALKLMRDSGFLSEEELAQKRKEILDDI
jgi:hypothetical protein